MHENILLLVSGGFKTPSFKCRDTFRKEGIFYGKMAPGGGRSEFSPNGVESHGCSLGRNSRGEA